jgi:uncharacterized protein YneF (UPF0154 family)
MNMTLLIEWLKQPSTIKAILLMAGLAGWKWSPDKIQEIIITITGLYAAVGALYEQQPRKPSEPIAPEDPPLTEARFRELLAEAKAKKQPPQG